MEWIEGPSIRTWLEDHAGEIELVTEVMRLVGQGVGGLHASGVVHGDLTTSNLILREDNGIMEVVIIDFGLGSVSNNDEDMAVDLYVLERAFASTHPKSEGLYAEILTSYVKAFPGSKSVMKKLETVRLRGRKRSMLG
jgi:TP53 regulating kinase and related kinases